MTSSPTPPEPSRKGDWIRTFKGVEYWPLDPRPEDVLIEDIAHALANSCRYAGHTSRFYSVAEHSIIVSRLVAPELALSGLLHDATEAYVVDVPRPLKRYLTNYAEIEELNWQAIAKAFDLDPVMHESIKNADNAILVKEMQIFMNGQKPKAIYSNSNGLVVPDDIVPIGMLPTWAEAAFMTRFKECLTLVGR